MDDEKPSTPPGAPMTRIMQVSGADYAPRGKRFGLTDAGTIEADASAYKAGGPGWFEVTRISTAKELIAALDELTPGVVVVWGEPPAESGLMTFRNHEKPEEGIYSRTATYFPKFSAPAVLVIDVDMPDPPPIAEMVAWLRSIGFGCDLVTGLSSSSGIRDAETGEVLKDGRGLRIYAIVNHGEMIPDALQMLIDRGWLQGWSRWMIGADGTPRVRGPADWAMHSPAQSDFSAAGAILGEGLTQDRTWTLHLGEERIQDVRRLAWLNADVTDHDGRTAEEEVRRQRRYARLMAAPAIKEARDQYNEEQTLIRATKAVAAGEFDDIRKAVDALRAGTLAELDHGRKTGVLPGWLELHTAKGIVTVREILADTSRWHMVACAEPWEPTYKGGAHTSTIMTGGGRPPVVNSHRSGMTTYRMIKAGFDLLGRIGR